MRMKMVNILRTTRLECLLVLVLLFAAISLRAEGTSNDPCTRHKKYLYGSSVLSAVAPRLLQASEPAVDWERHVLMGFARSLNKQSATRYTLLQGSVVEDAPGQKRFLDVKLFVVDKLLNVPVQHVYYSSAHRGHYYAILEPGKLYDIYMELPSYKAHVLTVRIPHQRYFYPVSQQVDIIPIHVGNTRIGQSLRVKNAFFDLSKLGAQAPDLVTAVLRQPSLDSLSVEAGRLMEESNIIGPVRLNPNNSANPQLSVLRQGKDYSRMLQLIEHVLHYRDTLVSKALALSSYRELEYSADFFYNNHSDSDYYQAYKLDGRTIEALPALQAYSADAEQEQSAYVQEMRFTDFEGFDLKTYRATPVEWWKMNAEANEAHLKTAFEEAFGARIRALVEQGCLFLLPFLQKEQRERYRLTASFLIDLGVPQERIRQASSAEVKVISKDFEIFAKEFGQTTLDVVILKPLEQDRF